MEPLHIKKKEEKQKREKKETKKEKIYEIKCAKIENEMGYPAIHIQLNNVVDYEHVLIEREGENVSFSPCFMKMEDSKP